jgi:Tol biopolymer transport system component
MNETEFRHQLLDLAEDAPSGSSAPPALLRRARRRVVLTIASSVAIAVLVVGMGIAGVRALQTAPTPADPPAPTPGRLGSLAYGVDGDIFVADWDGSNPVRIADGRPAEDCGGTDEYWGEGPIWSPDGRYLAYRHNTDCAVPRGPWDVVISDRDGNVVTSFPSEGWQISWSPDSTRVAVWISGGNTIGVYGLDGERQKVLTVPPGMMAPGDFDPVWSRDGASLLVPHGVEIPLNGTTPRRLPSSDPRAYSNTTYSPDGSRVAYTVALSLFVAAADGSRAQEVSARWVQNPVWSPTGDQIAFTYSETIHWPYATQVRVLDLATGTVTSLVGMGGSDMLKVIEFSPDGDRILFSRTEEGDSDVSSLWSVNADGSDVRRLVTGAFPGWGDWFSPSPTR